MTRPGARLASKQECGPYLEALLEANAEDLRHGERGAEGAEGTEGAAAAALAAALAAAAAAPLLERAKQQTGARTAERAPAAAQAHSEVFARIAELEQCTGSLRLPLEGPRKVVRASRTSGIPKQMRV